MIIKIIIAAFVIAWIGIIYSIITAPLVDEYGNIIKEKE
jgi:low affinity Fe/Cu permease